MNGSKDLYEFLKKENMMNGNAIGLLEDVSLVDNRIVDDSHSIHLKRRDGYKYDYVIKNFDDVSHENWIWYLTNMQIGGIIICVLSEEWLKLIDAGLMNMMFSDSGLPSEIVFAGDNMLLVHHITQQEKDRIDEYKSREHTG